MNVCDERTQSGAGALLFAAAQSAIARGEKLESQETTGKKPDPG